MEKLNSSRFRLAYISLTEPTEVTVLGRVIGVWTPHSVKVQDPVTTASLDWRDTHGTDRTDTTDRTYTPDPLPDMLRKIERLATRPIVPVPKPAPRKKAK